MPLTLESYASVAREMFSRASGKLHVVSAMYPSQPDGLLRALIDESARSGMPLKLMVADLSGQFAFLPESPPDGLEIVTIGGRVPARLSATVDHLPVSLGEISRQLGDGTQPIDAFVTQAAAPGAEGYCSFGPMVSYSSAAMAGADATVVEVNRDIPSLHGYLGAHLDKVDIIVWMGASSVAELPPRTPTIGEQRIGEHLAELIPDAATLQLGIGGIPESFMTSLSAKKFLGIHSGALPEGAISLIEAGVITGEAKEVDREIHITTSLLGRRRLYEYAASADNHVQLWPVEYTHNAQVLSKFRRFFAVNSCFEIDLLGQVNAEYVGGRKASSMGGQGDFGRWAHLAPEGANIIALLSQTSDGQTRILPRLPTPGCVTTHRSDVDFVVTEYGVAVLRGKSAWERARELCGVAHPDHRSTVWAGWS